MSADSAFLSFQQMMEFHDLLAENNMTLVTSVVVTDTTVDFKSLIARLVVSSITINWEIFARVL